MAARISSPISPSDLTRAGGAIRAKGRRSPGSGIEDLITGGEPMEGTAGDDFMFDSFVGTIDSTINANGGDDFVLGDRGSITIATTGNGSSENAIDLDASSTAWTRDENPLFANSSIPHRTIYFTAAAGEFEYFSIFIPAGETIIIDIDFGRDSFSHSLGTDESLDTVIELFAPDNALAASGANSFPAEGGLGSYSFFDSYLTHIATESGTYVIKLSDADNDTFLGGEEMVLNVSLTGHAVATPTPMGDDTIDGGAGNDLLLGVGGDDEISGGDGENTIHGGTGRDLLKGGAEDDDLSGGAGVDTLLGFGGNDELIGGAGRDAFNGGAGADWADYSTARKVTVDLQIPANNTRDALGDSYVSIANLRGGLLADNLRGDAGANRIEGETRNDVLIGRAGDDTLVGGFGFDQLAGQQGVDSFFLESDDPADYDRIVDFAANETILLGRFAFDLPTGALDPDAFVLGNSAQDAEDRIIYLESVGKLFFDPDGVGGASRQLIAIIENRPTLDASHFEVI